MSRGRAWRRTLAGAVLLLSNFPVAGCILVAAKAIETCYTVIVRNDSRQPLDGVRVFGGGSEASFGSIAPGGSARRSLWFRGEGVLEFRAVSDAAIHEKTIEGYVTGGMGGRATVTINPGGTITVTGSHGW